ncbi:MAG: hypothetical protein C6W57_15180 [Caldibacillus debilis]|nr:MAG: hypothetical protein C6W57_15180 [Caldibacillus debilis]
MPVKTGFAEKGNFKWEGLLSPGAFSIFLFKKNYRGIGMVRFHKKLIRFLSLFLILFLLSPQHHLKPAAAGKNPVYYVALGNSLAAGYQNDGTKTGKGYPYFIQKGLAEKGYSVELVNAGVGGYTTDDVLQQLMQDAGGILGSIQQADFITIDAGANDLLKAIDVTKINPNDPEQLQQAMNAALAVLQRVESNMKTILAKLKERNQTADIYVMGYYNALPYLENMQSLVVPIIQLLNQKIENAAGEYGAAFIPTFDLFAGRYPEYLPNPNDIHPNEAGYQAIAARFLERIWPNLPPAEKVPVWFSGEGAPAPGLGEENDRYLDTGALDVYAKTGDGWVKTGNLKEQGNGALLKGKGEPAKEEGKIGDFYFDEPSQTLYVKADEEVWLKLPDLRHMPGGVPGPGDGDGGDGDDQDPGDRDPGKDGNNGQDDGRGNAGRPDGGQDQNPADPNGPNPHGGQGHEDAGDAGGGAQQDAQPSADTGKTLPDTGTADPGRALIGLLFMAAGLAFFLAERKIPSP